MSHRHFTIVFALVFITVQFQPMFVLFVAISLSYVAISRPCHMSEFYLNKASTWGPPSSQGLDDRPPPTPYLKVWIRH